ncbi:hypothetical protein [Saccharopolyspora shandongensis]|uniref:hypothetical protein n=1 Tax=Saccharopolyspora shandongensis TaxID=418495 RepID=UPI00340D068E
MTEQQRGQRRRHQVRRGHRTGIEFDRSRRAGVTCEGQEEVQDELRSAEHGEHRQPTATPLSQNCPRPCDEDRQRGQHAHVWKAAASRSVGSDAQGRHADREQRRTNRPQQRPIATCGESPMGVVNSWHADRPYLLPGP